MDPGSPTWWPTIVTSLLCCLLSLPASQLPKAPLDHLLSVGPCGTWFHTRSVPYCIGGPLCHLIPLFSSPKRLTQNQHLNQHQLNWIGVKLPKLAWTIVTDWVPGHLGPSLIRWNPARCPLSPHFIGREESGLSDALTKRGGAWFKDVPDNPIPIHLLPSCLLLRGFETETSGKMLETALGDGPTGDTKGPQGPKEGITLLACCLSIWLSLLWNLRHSY